MPDQPDTPPQPSAHGADILDLTTQLAAAYVSHNEVAVADLPALIQTVHDALNQVSSGRVNKSAEGQEPAVPVNKSITPDYIVCLEDGKRLKMLKRYLRTHYDLSPDEYREKWNLPSEYPMVAPNYAAKRSEYAKQIGLGRAAEPKGQADD